jgi:hypothetical protein
MPSEQAKVDWSGGFARGWRGALWGLAFGAVIDAVLVAVALIYGNTEGQFGWDGLASVAVCTGFAWAVVGACVGVQWRPMPWRQRLRHVLHGWARGLLLGASAGLMLGAIRGAVAFAEDGDSDVALSAVIWTTTYASLVVALISAALSVNGVPQRHKSTAQRQEENAPAAPTSAPP